MDARQKMEERLWSYITGTSNAQESKAVEHLLATNPEWSSVYADMLAFEKIIGDSIGIEAPSMRFSKNVMEKISALKIAPATKQYVNKKIVYGIGAFFLLLILATLVYAIPQIDFSISGTSITEKLPGNQINWASLFKGPLFQIFLILDAFIGLYLLDRYLQRNKSATDSHQKMAS